MQFSNSYHILIFWVFAVKYLLSWNMATVWLHTFAREKSWFWCQNILVATMVRPWTANTHQTRCSFVTMPQNSNNERWTLIHVIAWCPQATSHYLTDLRRHINVPNYILKKSRNFRRCNGFIHHALSKGLVQRRGTVVTYHQSVKLWIPGTVWKTCNKLWHLDFMGHKLITASKISWFFFLWE